MTTPADWYPDPEDSASLRYWDGTGWTEHRAPAVPPSSPAEPPAAEAPAAPADEFTSSEQATSIVSLPPEQSTTAFSTEPVADPPAGADLEAGSHRAPDLGEEPGAGAYTPTPNQPYDTHPPTSNEPSSYQSSQPWDAPLPSWDAPSTDTPPVTETPRSWDAPPTETPRSWDAPPSETPRSWDAPPSETPRSWDAPPAGPSYAPPTAQSYEPASFAPPPGPPGSHGPSGGGEGPNKKLVIGIIGGAAAIMLAIILVIVFVVIRKEDPTVTAAQGTSTSESATSSSETTTSETETESSATEEPLPPPTGAQGTDGDYSFSVARTETGDTITSNVSDAVETTASGMYYVVHLNVANTGTSPLTFVATFQQLSAAGQTFPLDDTATAFLGGTIADIAPGGQVETPLVYDIPVGTLPDSILLRADPVSPGVTLPLQ